jgi:serine/threonine protein kinase
MNLEQLVANTITPKLKDSFQIIKRIGNGMAGTVYLVKFNDDKIFALKIEKIKDEYLEPHNLHSMQIREWREIEFSLNFANNYPDQFITLYDYDILENCEYEYTADYYEHLPKLPSHVRHLFEEKEKGTHCIRKLYSAVDKSLKQFKHGTEKQYYSITTQILYICYLLQINGYTHNDLHSDNVGISIVDENQTLNIFNDYLFLHGIHVKALDFGIVLHNKYEMSEEEKIQYKYNIKNEVNRYIARLIVFEKNNQIEKLVNWDKNLEFFQKWIHSEKINLVDNMASNNFDRYLVYQVLYPDEFQKEYFGDKYVKTYTFTGKIQINDFLYILEHKNDLKNLIKYMINKTNS